MEWDGSDTQDGTNEKDRSYSDRGSGSDVIGKSNKNLALKEIKPGNILYPRVIDYRKY